MAEALRIGKPAQDEKVIIERPGGSRVRVLEISGMAGARDD
jgi:hypothetical protein